MFMNHRTIGAAALALLFASVSHAQKGKGAEPAWKAKRDQLQQQVEKRVKQEVAKKATPRIAAEKLGLPWPVKKPTKGIEDIQAEVNRRVEAAVEKEYPRSRMNGFRAEADEKYRLYEVGERVTFDIRGGRGAGSHIEGVLRRVDAVRILVGSRWVIRRDVDEATLVHFDPDLSEEKRAKYVRHKTALLNGNREDLRESEQKTVSEELFEAAGYRYWKSRKQWVPISTILEQWTTQAKRVEAKRLRPSIENDLFSKNGYVKHRGEWMPTSVADKLRKQAQTNAKK